MSSIYSIRSTRPPLLPPHALLFSFELAFLESSQRLGSELNGKEFKIMFSTEIDVNGSDAKQIVREWESE